jgi:hypothetical protein
VKTTVYLQVVPRWRRSYGGQDPALDSIKVERVTDRQPKKPLAGSVVTKLTLDVADAAFLPIRPEAIVVIPVDHTQAVEVETEPIEVPE